MGPPQARSSRDAVRDLPWAWAVAAASCWIAFCNTGIYRSSGVLYVQIVNEYGVSRALASWPFSLFGAVSSFAGILPGILVRRWTIRQIVLLGSSICVLGVVASSFVDSVQWIACCFGVVSGLGSGLIMTLLPVILNQYFLVNRATASGIFLSGATLSLMVLPPLTQLLIETYYLHGTFLILGGIIMNIFIGALLLRPLPKDIQKDEKRESSCTMLDKMANQNSADPNVEQMPSNNSQNISRVSDRSITRTGQEQAAEMSFVSSYSSFNNIELTDCLCVECNEGCTHPNRNELSVVRTKNLPYLEQRLSQIPDCNTAGARNCNNKDGMTAFHSECHDNSEKNSSENLIFNQNESNTSLIQRLPGKQQTSSYHSKKSSNMECFEIFRRKCNRGTTESFISTCGKTLSSPMFILITFCSITSRSVLVTFSIVIVDYLLDKGLTESQGVLLVSVVALPELVGRLGSGWISDHRFIKRKHVFLTAQLISGAVLSLLTVAQSQPLLYALSALFALANGGSFILINIFYLEYLGMDRLPIALSLKNVFMGVASLLRPLYIGLFRDRIHSYDYLFHSLAILSIASGAIWWLEPKIQKHINRTSAQTSS